MQVASTTQSEIQLTLEATVGMLNRLDMGEIEVRSTLQDHGFPRAKRASQASVDRLASRLAALAPLFLALPGLDDRVAAERVNEQLVELPLSPSIIEHDGVALHLHWTPNTATFDDQVMADILMALAQEVCDNGTIRFGRCGAADCDHLFYDGTRNRSRRFCNNPRCASKTHTADHRARKKTERE